MPIQTTHIIRQNIIKQKYLTEKKGGLQLCLPSAARSLDCVRQLLKLGPQGSVQRVCILVHLRAFLVVVASVVEHQLKV